MLRKSLPQSKVYDLTPVIHPGLAVFPGDQKFERKMAMSFSQGHHLELSSINSTVHLGAHADSSGHYHAEGKGIESRPLSAYMGLAQVIEVECRPSQRIQIADLKDHVIKAPRVLFKTLSFPDPNHWNFDFMSLSPELIHFLADKGCVLVGIDTPSVDPEDCKNLFSHQALFKTGICVLEGLVMTRVPAGLYSLVAAPLPMQGLDASPVRALLFDDPHMFHKYENGFEIL